MEKQKRERANNLELTKRIRSVREWIIDDWDASDIERQCMQLWGVTDRQGRTYIKQARLIWDIKEDEKIEVKRRKRIAKLCKLERRLDAKYQRTPQGVMAILSVEKVIIELEGTKPPERIEHLGIDGEKIIIGFSKINEDN